MGDYGMTDKENTLTDDEIIKIITDYVNEEIYNYAVMLDGGWGCGKTYFIKERLCGKLEENEKKKAKKDKGYTEKRLVYLSLYGVKALEDISKQILIESYISKTRNKREILKKGTEITGAMLPILFDNIKPLTGLELKLNAKSISNVLGKFLSVKDSILIFDDLERCDCPVNEILGYIC